MKKTFLFSLGLSVLSACASQLMAGVVYTLNTKEFQDGSAGGKMKVFIEGDDLRVEMVEGGAREGAFIFKGKERTMLMIDDKRRQYMVMDEQTIQGLASQMNQAMAEYQKMLESVPPQQRAMMEQMMKQQMGNMMQQAAPAKESVLTKSGKNKSISGYQTIHYLEKMEGLLENEYWVTNWNNVDGGEEVMDAFKNMAKFQEELFKAFSSGGNNPLAGVLQSFSDNMFKKLNDLEGFPVAVINYDQGVKSSETILESIDKRSLEAALFSPPKGYKRQNMGM